MMTRMSLDGLIFLLFGGVVFIVSGIVLENSSHNQAIDYKALYYPARCLIQQCDPYNVSEVLRVYQAENVVGSSDTAANKQAIARYIYLPTAFSFTIPFAALPWGTARTLWISLTISSLFFASLLIWDIGADYDPIVSGVLLGFLLANSEVIVALCNSTGIAVSLCVVAVWCFLRKRYLPIAILCMAFSLVIKPQDSGLVWLYFLLAGGVYRKRALQTLYTVCVLSLPVVLWVWYVAPSWIQEWHTNILVLSTNGGILDPGFASTLAHGRTGVISLQAVVSCFWDNSHIYNLASYLVCGTLLLIWSVQTLRLQFSVRRAWLALASIAAISILPVCHHLYDTKLLLLTVPACAMLWAKGGPIRWFALLVTAGGFVFTGDISLEILGILSKQPHMDTGGISGKLLTVVLIQPAPLALLAVAVFYLWAYARRAGEDSGVELAPRSQDHMTGGQESAA